MSQDKLREAKNLFHQGQIEKAYLLCKELCKESPKKADVHHLYSMVLTQLGDIPLALKHISTAIELMPEAAQLHNNKGNIYLRSGSLSEAITCYEQAILLDNQYAPAHNNLGNCFFKMDQLSI